MMTILEWNRMALRRFICIALLATASVVFSTEIEGRVVSVHDGDSTTVLTGETTQIRVRLAGIDALELKQPFSAAAKKTLSDMVFSKKVRIDALGKDRYGRTLGNVYVRDLWVNHSIVLKGMAWFYLMYSHDETLRTAEISARTQAIGLWSDSKPMPPWDWRKSKH